MALPSPLAASSPGVGNDPLTQLRPRGRLRKAKGLTFGKQLFIFFMSSAQLPFPVLCAWSVFGYMCGTLFASTYSLYAEYLPWKMLPALLVTLVCELLTRWTPPPFERPLQARLQYGIDFSPSPPFKKSASHKPIENKKSQRSPRLPKGKVGQMKEWLRRFILLCIRRGWRLVRIFRLAFMYGMFVEAFKVGS